MIINEQILKKVIKSRPLDSHKGDFGRLLLIGGLYPYGGAIILAAKAIVHAGAGLVTVATEKDNISALHAHIPEAMAFDFKDHQLLFKSLSQADAILIGPGLSENGKARDIFDFVLKHCAPDQILIVDGSALNLMAEKETSAICQNQPIILTPHQKEWERLSGIPILNQTVAVSQEVLRNNYSDKTLLVAKSHQTKVMTVDQVAELTVGGPYQATGGMGDTLAGMIAAFSVQFKESSLFERVIAATYLHSAIANQLSNEDYVVLPSKISSQIPRWMKRYEDKKE